MNLLRINTTYKLIVLAIALVSAYQLGQLGESLSDRVVYPNNNLAANFEVNPTVVAEENPGFTPARIEVTSAGLEMPVYVIPNINGKREVTSQAINYDDTSDLVSEKSGNVGLYADSNLIDFQQGKDLAVGTEIAVYGQVHKATYKVISSENTVPSKVYTFTSTRKPTLTIIIYNGTKEMHRYIVRSELVKLERLSK